jgi:DNA topoisomerase-2
MIIKKELTVSGRKRADIIKDLRSKGFKTFAKVPKAVVQETENDVEEDAEEDNGPDNGYDYLLNV